LIETARTAIVTSDTRKRHRGRPTEPVAKKMTRFKKSDDKANEVDPHTKETESITIAPHETPSWRRDKAKALGLKGRTAFPMFSHRLSAKEIKEHPQFDKWHMHRQAMQNEILEQWQLPPHFQSMKGRYVFPTKKKVSIPKQGETAKEQRDRQDRKNTSERSRHAKLRDLKLHRSSAVPSFARTLSVGSLKDSSHINDWHKHREMMETGTMEQKDLPLKFKSRIPGKLILRDIDMKEKPIDEKETKKQIKSLQKQERSAKLKELYLHRNSATPIFAQNMKAEDIKHYDEIDNWHHHRDALQRGSIKESDLPDHFKPNRGALKFRLRPYLPDEQRSKENGASASQFNNGPRSQMGLCRYNDLERTLC
jgi:hypothetical protein